jgi:hypothetical protein
MLVRLPVFAKIIEQIAPSLVWKLWIGQRAASLLAELVMSSTAIMQIVGAATINGNCLDLFIRGYWSEYRENGFDTLLLPNL